MVPVIAVLIIFVILQKNAPSSNGAGFGIAFEAESASLIGGTNVGSDVNASAGAYVKFSQTGTSSCALPKYPTPACTGVPVGVTFTNTVNGTYTVTTSGTVIDRWNIHGDLHILADNTTITNSQIDGTVNNQGTGENYYSFTVSDSTVGPANGCVGSPGVGESKYTATRIYVRNHDDGFRLSGTGNGTVRDSYFHACYLPPAQAPPDGSHSDGVQAVCGGNACPVFNIIHNTLDLKDVPATFPLNLTDNVLSSVTATDNLLLGGNNYLIDAWWHSGVNWIFTDNRLVQGTWGSNTSLNFAVTAENTCSHQTWTGNTVVTIDANYNVTSTVQAVPCIN